MTWFRVFAGMLGVGACFGLPHPEAHAQGRPTVIVNLAADQGAGQLVAEDQRAALQNHPNLRPLSAGELSRRLELAVPTEGDEVAVLARARELLKRAKAEFGNFRHKAALDAVANAETALLAIEPRSEQLTLLADLAFFAGRVQLREQNRGLARSQFELTLRLQPEFPSPDPGRFNPDIVSTFAEAKKNVQQAATATLEVNATVDDADVFVDGKKIGVTPLAVTVSAGSHYVAVLSAEHRMAARRLDVGAGDALDVAFELLPLALEDVALRLRKAAIKRKVTVGGPRLESVARAFQDLTESDSAIIIRGTTGQIEISVFRRSTKSGTSFRSADSTNENGANWVIALLSPVRTLRPDELFNANTSPVVWYKRPDVIGIGAGGLLTVVALSVFAIAASDNSKQPRTGVIGGGFL